MDLTAALNATVTQLGCAGQAEGSWNRIEKQLTMLLQQKKLPVEGLSEDVIELFLRRMSLMDSNNFDTSVGVGEREGRILCPAVRRRHMAFAHGIGRSGDVTAVQPKAAGSSLVNKLANALVLDVIRTCGIRSCASCFIVPTATGLALTLCMSYFKSIRPDSKYVVWCRIDQKSCFKSIFTAGLQPIVIEPILQGDELKTNLDEIKQKLRDFDPALIACVLTTTSCFAPRAPDSLEEVGKLCAELEIPHLVNNAYGLQSTKCCHLIEQANRVGRVDAFVQSTDKNLLVPVGGAIIAGFQPALVDSIAKFYPGRASSVPSMDVLTTLLWLGKKGFENLLAERKQVYKYFKEQLMEISEKFGIKVLHTPSNQISMAISLENFGDASKLSQLGSMLFIRHCTGHRVVTGGELKTINGIEFVGWQSHCKSYPVPYINVAAGLGMKKNEVDVFIERLKSAIRDLRKRDIEKCDHVENVN